MRRLVALVVLAGTLAWPAPPAAAHVEVCYAEGSFQTTTGFFHPVLGPPRTAWFSLSGNFTVCASDSSPAVSHTLSGSGSVYGNGGFMTGSGVLRTAAGSQTHEHQFMFSSAGDKWVLWGDVAGWASIAVNPTYGGNSCTSPTGAHNWLLSIQATGVDA